VISVNKVVLRREQLVLDWCR